EQIAAAKADGVTFFKLPESEMETLRQQAETVYEEFSDKINKLHEGDTYRPDNYLQEVRDYLENGEEADSEEM
ncbi:MAG: hypothetical protein ACLFS7_07275, partial [Desulfosudaceae bacterium]